MSATPIDPKDIRVGDRVRSTFTEAHEGVVTRVSPDELRIRTSDVEWFCRWPYSQRTFELLDRPKPEAKPRTFWRDPKTGAVYVRTEFEPGSAYRPEFALVNGAVGTPMLLTSDSHLKTIVRLIPEDAS